MTEETPSQIRLVLSVAFGNSRSERGERERAERFLIQPWYACMYVCMYVRVYAYISFIE